MNNYLYNIPDDWYNFGNNQIDNSFKEFNNNFTKANNNQNIFYNNIQLYSSMEGLERGNLFKDLYDPYKNYKYGNLSASSPRQELLNKLLSMKFALNDLNLYLDNHPDDNEYISLFNKYLVEEKKICNEYEKKYGPLTACNDYGYGNNFNWINSPWPWEGVK